MAQDSFQERTERATPRRRDKAREEGKVSKSMELNSAVLLTLGFLTIYLLGPTVSQQAMQIMANSMANAPTIAASDSTFLNVFTDAMLRFFSLMMPIMIAVVIIAVGINVAQVGFKISSKALEPKLDKLNMIEGFKRLFSTKSLAHLIRDLLKLIVIGFVAYKSIEGEFDSFFLLPDQTIAQLAAAMGYLSLMLTLKLGAIILVIAIIDYMYQKYEFEKSIRMTRQEIKEEYKDTEGSPQIKSRTRQLQREMAQKRMMSEVPTADVVITNPTHIAVALKYDPDTAAAPIVVAKGERLIAQRIKEIALENDIPTYEDKPLARALFKMCEIGQSVPMQLYRAVAEVLAYVYRLKGKAMN